jgi:hypothetical protein
VPLVLLVLFGCNGGARVERQPRASANSARARSADDARIVRPAPAAQREPQLLITDREALAVIEQRTGSFATVALAASAPDNAALSSHPAYRALADVLAGDVSALGAHDPQAGVGIRGNAHRLFDVRWLRAREARFELVAVANRLDRHAFAPEACGELRLVYRLAYHRRAGAVELASRLPMTIAIELRADSADAPGDCAQAARRWLTPAGSAGQALGRLLVDDDGPLSTRQLTRARITQLVTNVQTVRWPSAVRPDLGGHAEYVLRSFRWDATSALYRTQMLENTPDVARLRREPALRAELLRWLTEPDHARELDRATARIPDRFLAESVVSVTPRGLARRANRPFRSLFEPSAFASLPPLLFARSPEAFVRRLDDLTCSGCHQSRSIAGFHVLGDDDERASLGNALFTGTSPHTRSDLPRREAYTRTLARGEQGTLARPFAERALVGDDGYGAHCGLGDPGFAHWTCAEGLRCDAYEAAAGEQTVGVCLPPRPGTGDPCEPARVRAHVQPAAEHVEHVEQRPCEQVCERTRVGFPGGMCASSCAALGPDAACGGIAILTPFNLCLARERPFAECVRDHVRPAGLRACSDRAPCRDDYVCTRSTSERGVCLPPYFVFQLRVDGHPEPR